MVNQLHRPPHILEACGGPGVSEHCGGLFKASTSLCDQTTHLSLGDVWPTLSIQRSGGGGGSLMESGVCVTLGSTE